MFERSGSLLERKFREYLIPTILTTVAISLATVIDSVIVGHLLGETALSAIGLAAPVIYSLNALFLLFAVGGVTCAAIAKGEREPDKANRIFTLTFLAGISVMVVFITLLLIFMGPIAHSLAQGDALLEALTYEYLVPLVFVGPVMMLIMGMAQFVRTDGMPKAAAQIALVANGVDLALTYIFIEFMNMGITGASLSTVIGYVAGIAVLVPYFRSKQRGFRFVKLGGGSFKQTLEIMNIGSPKALTQGMSFARTLVLNLLIVAALGAPGMAAMMLCVNALMIASIFISGSNDTLLPIIGTLFGEKDDKGIRFTMRTGFRFMIVASVAVTLLFLILPGTVARLFGINSAEGLAAAEPALRLFALSLPIFGINNMLQNFYQTTGRVKIATTIVSLNGFGFVILFALLLAGWNGTLIWLAFVLSELATLLVVLCMGVYIRKKENVKGMLLLRSGTLDNSLDLSISATTEAAVGLSERVMEFCHDMRMGIAVEEMAVNIARYGHKHENGVIDVLVRATEDELLLRLRDDGVPFNPTQYRPEEETEFAIGGIEVVRRLAKDISYDRQLGFNVTVVTISREILE